MSESNSLIFYNDRDRAERYHQRKGFAPERTARMHAVMLDLLTAMTPPQSTMLELGAGTGLFTAKLLGTNHFREIYVTDGAPAMLDVARQTFEKEQTLDNEQMLEKEQTPLHFLQLDFTTDWVSLFAGIHFDAVTSSMALHHAADKQRLFQQIASVLKTQGVFILADHMAGATPYINHLLVRERAYVRLGKENKGDHARLQEIMDGDAERGRKEGNRCESVAQYENYLRQSGFEDVECIWRDYWLAIFVARKQSQDFGPGEAPRL